MFPNVHMFLLITLFDNFLEFGIELGREVSEDLQVQEKIT